MQKLKHLRAGVMGAALLLGGLVCADDIHYTGVSGGEWVTGANWSSGTYPAITDIAYLDTTANLSVKSPNNIQGIRVGTSADGRLQIGSQASLTANTSSTVTSIIGDGSGHTGSVLQEGGTVEINRLTIGSNSGSGIYHIHSGTLSITRESGGNSLFLATSGSGEGTFRISSGSFVARAGVQLGSASGGMGRFEVIGSHPGAIGIGSTGTLDGRWIQYAGSTLSVRIDKTAQGITPIFIDETGGDGGGDVVFENGALLDVDFTAAFLNGGTFTVMEWEGDVTDKGLRFASSVDTHIWSFKVDVANKRLTVTAVGSPASRAFVHPGLSHKRSDLDRMRDMVAAGVEPYASTFAAFASNGKSQHTYQPSTTAEELEADGGTANNNALRNDGVAAYYNALMWYITGDERHAEAAIRIFTVWSGVTNISGIPLNAGRHWRLIEAAEIIKSTYDGWEPSDLQAFKDMLVYPGYSNASEPGGNRSIYWRAYQGDPARHGNQGLFAMRCVMAIGVFLDNEIIYDRALRYLQGAPARRDDIPYVSGPSVAETQIGTYEHFLEFSRTGQESTIADYGYNEVIHNYIYPNGQSQEFSRDMAHGLAGIGIIATMSEMAWSQGDDLYGHLNNRPLLGLEYYYRYNLSYERSFPDQTTSWEPTVENGEFIQRLDQSGRWFSLKANPYLAQNTDPEDWHRGRTSLIQAPMYEMNLAHYRDRMGVLSEDTKWLQRGHNLLVSELGFEGEGTPWDHPSWGGLTFHRVSPGDPVEGFTNGVPMFEMNVLPATIGAENYDYFALGGEGRTYHDLSIGNSAGEYRRGEGVDITASSEGEYALTGLEDGEWLTYTVSVPTNGPYDISIRCNASSAGGSIQFSFDGVDRTGAVTVPVGNGWQDVVIAEGVALSGGVQQMKVSFSGMPDVFELSSISIEGPFLPYVVSTTKSDTAPEMSDSDLAQTQYFSSSATGGEAVATRHAELFNGVIGDNDSGTGDSGVVRMNSDNTVSVTFDTSVHTNGYDLTGITTCFGWNPASGGRSNQGYELILTYMDGSTATLAGPAHWEPNSPASYWTTVTFTNAPGRLLASGIKAVTWDITQDANASGVLIAREFDVFGTPTLNAEDYIAAFSRGNLSFSNGYLNAQFSAIVGADYRAEWKESLMSSNGWMTVTNFQPLENSPFLLSVPATNGAAFFRVLWLP
ncbi:carbohydrate-binding protein [Pontiellaceae bacterium B1224]|nr:carbohydrate-binding protein [Pontiellaceae bacterium B1224]